MVALKKEFITFIVGAGLSAAGLTSVPLSEAFLTAGSALISLSYGIVLFSWRAGRPFAQAKTTGAVAPPSTPQTQAPPMPQPTAGPATSVSAPAAERPSVTPPSAPSPPSISAPTPPMAPPSTPPTPSPPPSASPELTPPSYATPPPPSAPPIEQPKPSGRKLPSVKAPRIALPKFVVDNKIPVALLGAGLIVLIAGLLVLGVPPQPLVGIGLLIPGGLFFGLGAILLYQRLRPSVAEVVTRRFCMHCGYEMSPRDISCGRCHRQPPSGVDTKVCPNCTAVIPTLAKFCKECGAGQPASA